MGSARKIRAKFGKVRGSVNLFAEAHRVLSSAGDLQSEEPINLQGGAEKRGSLDNARELLLRLGYLRKAPKDGALQPTARDPATLENRLALLSLAGKFERVFQLPARNAPGAIFLGGEIAPEKVGLAGSDDRLIGSGGRGTTFRQAFEGCVGEAAERLSYLDWGDVPTFISSAVDLASRAAPGTADSGRNVFPMASDDLAWMLEGVGLNAEAFDRQIPWVTARSLDEKCEIVVPADLCLQRSQSAEGFTPRPAESNGCACGPTLETAKYSALMELVERDAVALWWYGGDPASRIDLEARENADLSDFLSDLRGGVERRTWFLDITSDLAIPAVAALSSEDDGSAVIAAFSADLDRSAAACSAALELCQMELALDLVHLKLHQNGPGGLNNIDRRHLERQDRLTVESYPQLSPGPGKDQPTKQPIHDESSPLQTCVEALYRAGFEAYTLDLSRPQPGLPSVRVIVPGLQSAKPGWVTKRLRHSLELNRRNVGTLAELPPLI